MTYTAINSYKVLYSLLQVKSETLANAINESSKMVELLGGEQYARLICCFLNPDLMVSGHKHLAKNLPHIPKRELDLVYELFHPSHLDSKLSSCITSCFVTLSYLGTAKDHWK